MKALLRVGFLIAAAWLSACAGLPHADPHPQEGHGGYAEWRWPYHEVGETWAEQLPHPDKVPTAFRTAQVRLQQMRQGCAWLLFPAYVTAAERQYNKALRAFAAEFYDDAFVDLRALNNQIDEIDRRLQIAGAGAGCSKRRNRYCDGESHGPCTGGGCASGNCGQRACSGGGCAPVVTCSGGSCGSGPCVGGGCGRVSTCSGGSCGTQVSHGGCRDCGYVGPEFNCASGTGLLRKPGCGCVNGNCQYAQAVAQPVYVPQLRPVMPVQPVRPLVAPAPVRPAVPVQPQALLQPLRNIFLRTQFNYDSDVVLPEYRAYLSDLASELAMAGYPEIEVHGHASSEGSVPYNRDLANRRANAVRNVLISHGIPSTRIFLQGFGEHQPIENNATEMGRAANRRVEIFTRGPAGQLNPAGTYGFGQDQDQPGALRSGALPQPGNIQPPSPYAKSRR